VKPVCGMLHKPSLAAASNLSLRALVQRAEFYVLWWWIKMRKGGYSGRVGGLTA
jgi:hypothetical protein